MVTNILYRLEYLSISLMALITLLTLFSFHFELSLRGQIECSVSVVIGLKWSAKPLNFQYCISPQATFKCANRRQICPNMVPKRKIESNQKNKVHITPSYLQMHQ